MSEIPMPAVPVARPPRPASLALVVAMMGVFVAELGLAAAAPSWYAVVLRLGAGSGPLVAEGDVWRVVSGLLVHVDFWHLLLVSVWLVSFGVLVEWALGAAGYLIVTLVSGVVGFAIGGVFETVALGGSAICMGHLGALPVLGRAGLVPLDIQVDRAFRLRMSLLAFVLLVLSPTSFLAHGVSFFVGFALATGLVSLSPSVRRPLAVAVLLPVLGALVAAGLHVRAADPRLRLLLAASRSGYPSTVALNNLAWMVATDRTATAPELDAAIEVARRAVLQGGGSMETDTLAQALHRRGQWDEAIRLETAILMRERRNQEPATGGREWWERRARLLVIGDEETEAIYGTQLSRFVAASLKARPITPADSEGAALSLTASPTGPQLAVTGAPATGVRIWALAPKAVMEACVPAGHSGPVPVQALGAPPIPGTPLTLAYSAATPCATADARWYVADDERLLELP